MVRCGYVRIAYLLVLIPALASAQPAQPAQPDGAGSGSSGSATEPALHPTNVPLPPPPTVPGSAEYVGTPQADTMWRTAHSGSWWFRPGGFMQLQYRSKQNSVVGNDQDGFRYARARFTATGGGQIGSLYIGSYFEAELQPTFSLYDAYVSLAHDLPGHGMIDLDVGQQRVPISRQQLLSDTRRAFVDGALIQTIAPDRDLGAKLTLNVPFLRWVRIIGGAFNGEGRNQVQNINEHYFWAGRIEVTPIGGVQPYEESGFTCNWLSGAADVGRNLLTPGIYEEKQLSMGYDISGCWNGRIAGKWIGNISGSFEYLQVNHYYLGAPSAVPGVNYHANGFTAQLSYMLPLKIYRDTRLELSARVEEIDRDNTDPISLPGDPNQSQRVYTGVISYYLNGHRLKIQVAGYHYQQIEDRTQTGASATYPEDQIVAQLTYRAE